MHWEEVEGKGTNAERRRRFLVLCKRLPDPSTTSFRATVTCLKEHLSWLVGVRAPDAAPVDEEAMVQLSAAGFLEAVRADVTAAAAAAKSRKGPGVQRPAKGYESDDCESDDE